MGKANGEAKAGKMYSADVVAALLMSFSITSIPAKHFKLMSALDGQKTASGFEHDFRAVLAKARELKQRVDDGEQFEPVQPGKKRAASTMKEGIDTPPATPPKKAKTTTPRKPRGKAAGNKKADVDTANDASPELDNGEAMAEVDAASESLAFNEDNFNEFIKQEMEWD